MKNEMKFFNLSRKLVRKKIKQEKIDSSMKNNSLYNVYVYTYTYK